jgi:hypothetical protein
MAEIGLLDFDGGVEVFSYQLAFGRLAGLA